MMKRTAEEFRKEAEMLARLQREAGETDPAKIMTLEKYYEMEKGDNRSTGLARH
jgi:hypothetical protein